MMGAVASTLIAITEYIVMADRNLGTPVASAMPSLLFAMALLTASLGVSRYLDAAEQLDIHETDAVYLARLDADQQRQYQDYRDHRVYPDPAARWVGNERELRELKQWIKQHDLIIQVALSRESQGEEAEAFKNWLH
jgi:hypothetical protein